MATPYQVEYQVFSAVYLDPERVLSGPDFARLWAATSVFGKENTYGYLHHHGAVPNTRRARAVKLGSLKLLQPMLDEGGDRPIFGGFSRGQPTRRYTDCDFHFAHHDPGGRQFGYDDQPGLLMLGLSGQWYERTGTEVVLEAFRRQFEVADRYAPPYGLIDIGAATDCYSGSVYVASYGTSNVPLHRHAEQIRWAYACSRRSPIARGVYWGNYFGPALLDRLGGRDHFLTGFRNETRLLDGTLSGLVWEFPNGVFVGLSHDPLTCKPEAPTTGHSVHCLHWLLWELGSRGCLDPWSAGGPPPPVTPPPAAPPPAPPATAVVRPSPSGRPRRTPG